MFSFKKHMVLSVTFKDTLYLFDVVGVRDDYKKRKLFLIRWAEDGFLLAERIPILNHWLRQSGFLLDDGFQTALFSALDKLLSRKTLIEQVSLSEITELISKPEVQPTFVPTDPLPKSA